MIKKKQDVLDQILDLKTTLNSLSHINRELRKEKRQMTVNVTGMSIKDKKQSILNLLKDEQKLYSPSPVTYEQETTPVPLYKEHFKTGEINVIIKHPLQEKRSGSLKVTTPQGSGAIHFHQGEVISAHFEREEGERAIFEILNRENGSCAFYTDTLIKKERNINQAVSRLIRKTL